MPFRISPPAFLSHFSQNFDKLIKIEQIYPAFTLRTGTLFECILFISTTLNVPSLFGPKSVF